jgi:hypothetical protein
MARVQAVTCQPLNGERPARRIPWLRGHRPLLYSTEGGNDLDNPLSLEPLPWVQGSEHSSLS